MTLSEDDWLKIAAAGYEAELGFGDAINKPCPTTWEFLPGELKQLYVKIAKVAVVSTSAEAFQDELSEQGRGQPTSWEMSPEIKAARRVFRNVARSVAASLEALKRTS